MSRTRPSLSQRPRRRRIWPCGGRGGGWQVGHGTILTAPPWLAGRYSLRHSCPPPTPFADFDFELPPELIAQHPAPERSASRLLDGRGAHAGRPRCSATCPACSTRATCWSSTTRASSRPGCCGDKASGGAVEALVERVLPGHEVLAHLRASKSPRPGSVCALPTPSMPRCWAAAGPTVRCSTCASRPTRWRCWSAHGHVPLPPYITHADDGRGRARATRPCSPRGPGAVAAPTAALHFDDAAAGRAGAQRGVAARRA